MINNSWFDLFLDLLEYMVHQMFLNSLMKTFLYFIILYFVVWCFRKVLHV